MLLLTQQIMRQARVERRRDELQRALESTADLPTRHDYITETWRPHSDKSTYGVYTHDSGNSSQRMMGMGR